jgi:hypothetical protein
MNGAERKEAAMGLRWQKSVAVAVVRPYVIDVTFEDGTHREVDLEVDLWGPVFEPLRDEALFRQAAVDPIGGSVYWPTGADLAPEFLYFGEDAPDDVDGSDRTVAYPTSQRGSRTA